MGAKGECRWGKRGKEYNVPDWSHLDLQKLPPPPAKPSQYNPVHFVRSWYESYKIITAIYMLEPWEEVLLNFVTMGLLFIFGHAIVSLSAYMGVTALLAKFFGSA